MSKIAIVGAGIAGLVAADQLQGGHDIVLFEKNDDIGGRVQTAEIEFAGQTYYQDWGAEYYIDKNTAIAEVVANLGLETEEYLSRRVVLDPSTGDTIIFPSSKDTLLQRVGRMISLFAKLKGDALKLNTLTQQFTDDIAVLYDILDSYPIDEALEQVRTEYSDYLSITLKELFIREGMSEDTLNNVVSPLFRPIYMLDASEINSFLGALAFAAKGSTIYHVKGGNSRMIEALYQNIENNVDLQMNTIIGGIKEFEDGTITLLSDKKEILGTFDHVFISGPLTALSTIDISTHSKVYEGNNIRYHQVYHTIVQGRPTDIIRKLVNKAADTIFISGEDAEVWEFNIIAMDGKDVLCDLTTNKPLVECDLDQFFLEEPQVIMQKHWKKAYPYYSPEVIQSLPVNNQITENLYIGSDSIITSMDSSIRYARHFVEMVNQVDTKVQISQ